MDITRTITIGSLGILGVASTVLSVKACKDISMFNKKMDELSDGIEIDIPEKIVNLAVEKAASKVATAECFKVSKRADDIIKDKVMSEVSSVKKTLSDKVKVEVENQISVLDISDIKKEIVKDVSSMVFKDVIGNISRSGYSDSFADVIKACTDAGMHSWEIENILSKLK